MTTHFPNIRFVNLKVYNNPGKEIISLVNEKQNAGSYEVDLNGKLYLCFHQRF